jgi:acetate---CoA ligase (ADP-forming)
MADPGAAFGAVIHDRVAGGGIHDGYLDYLRAGRAATGKPAFLVSNHQGTGADPAVIAAAREGFPVLDGVPSFLRGVRCLLDYRDHLAHEREHELPHSGARASLAPWRARLATGAKLDEHDSLALLRDFQLPANHAAVAESASEARAVARELGYPVVLKTAARGIDHKSDRDGVRLNIEDDSTLTVVYDELASRLGPRALIAPMHSVSGVEMLLGMIRDEQFGPVVLLGFGGVHVEALADVVYAMPPFGEAEARRLLDRLKLRALLNSPRHKRPLALDAFCHTAARFSSLVAELGDTLSEMDLNPVILHAGGCIILDALVVGHASRPGPGSEVRIAS